MGYRLVLVFTASLQRSLGHRALQLARLKPPDVKFVPTPQKTVSAMLALVRVTVRTGLRPWSGDGRIPIAAAKEYGARGVGIEIDPILHP
jgi:hypothetical protein